MPEHDGGCKITSYIVESRESTEEDTEQFVEVARVKSGVTTYVLENLAENKKYDVQIRACNEIGVGEASMPVTSIMTKDSSGEKNLIIKNFGAFKTKNYYLLDDHIDQVRIEQLKLRNSYL